MKVVYSPWISQNNDQKTRDANVYITNEFEDLFKRYLPPKTVS